jgi:ABC-type uncharacterized transport system permease subunit
MVSTLAAVSGLAAAAAYLAGTVLQARQFSLGPSEGSGRRTSTPVILAALGAILHGIAIYQVIYDGTALYLGIFTSASLVSWIMVVFVLLANLRLPVRNTLVVALPIAIGGTLLALGGRSSDAAMLPVSSMSDALIWHIMISIVAYSILFMAACHSVLLALLEHSLKTKRTFRFLRLLPPLQTMETLLFNLLWAGIVALSLAIATGFLFLDNMFEQRVVHHTVLALASWWVYAILLAGHRILGWRGTTAVRWTLIAFSLLVLGYFGSKFVIEILLES